MKQVAMVTGGIGLETAKKFLVKGYQVAIASIDSEDVIKQAMDELTALGDAVFISCNVADAEQCRNAVSKAVEHFGTIDVLAHVAGVVGQRVPLIDADLADLSNTIQINLMGTIQICQSVGQVMVKNRTGVIINVGSICGAMANTESIGYHASKGGVRMATQAMARELSPYGIRVLSVAPGWNSLSCYFSWWACG